MVRHAELSLGGIVHQRDVEAIARELQRKDRLKRGRVSRMELGEALEDLGYNDDSNLRGRLHQFDRDGTGTVAYEAMLDFIEQESADYVRGKIQRRVHRMNDPNILSRLLADLEERADGDSTVTRWQFRAALEDAGISISVEELRCVVDQLDRAGTNRVPYTGFLHFLREGAVDAVGVDAVQEERAQEALRRLRKDAGLYSRRQLLSHLRRLSTEDDLLFHEELRDAAQDLGAALSPGEMDALQAYLDPHGIGIEPEALVAQLLEGEGSQNSGGESGLILAALRRCIRESRVSYRQFQALAREESAEVARDNLRRAVQEAESNRHFNLLGKLRAEGTDEMTARELYETLLNLGVAVQEQDVHASVVHLTGEAGASVPIDLFAAFAGARRCAEQGRVDEILSKLRRELAPRGKNALKQHFDRYDGRRHGYLFTYALEEAMNDIGVSFSSVESSLLIEYIGRGGVLYIDGLVDGITEGAAIACAPKGENGAESLKALRQLLREARESGLQVLRIFYRARFRSCQEPSEVILSQEQLSALRRLLRNSGKGAPSVSRLDLREACANLDLQDLYRNVLKPNIHRFDQCGDGRVQVDEMLEFVEEEGARYVRLLILRLLRGNDDNQAPLNPWSEEDAPCVDSRALIEAFRECDYQQRGFISRWQFQSVLEDSGIYLAPEECLSICDYIDPDVTNAMRYKQFLSFIGVYDERDEDFWTLDDVLEGLRSDLGAYTSSRLLSHFKRFDTRATGLLPRWLFEDALADIGVRLTSPEAHVLSQNFDAHDGETDTPSICYTNFVSSLLEDIDSKYSLEGLSRLVKRGVDSGVDMMREFARYDRRMRGEVRESDFVQALKDMGLALSRGDAAVFIKEFGGSRLGWVRYGDFVRLIQSPGARVTGRRMSQQDRLDVLVARMRHEVDTQLKKGQRTLAAVERMLNNRTSGHTVSIADFRAVVQNLGLGLSQDEISVLEDHLDKKKTGRVAKEDLLAMIGPKGAASHEASISQAGGVGWNPARRTSVSGRAG